MNILFFLTPKQDVAYLYDDFTLRQALEKMEHYRFGSIPILNRQGEYIGTISEGDLLWGIKNHYDLSLKDAERVSISALPRKRDYQPVMVDTSMDDLIATAITQNFVPVIDSTGTFIGIIRRQELIQYCYNQYLQNRQPLPAEQVALIHKQLC